MRKEAGVCNKEEKRINLGESGERMKRAILAALGVGDTKSDLARGKNTVRSLMSG